MLYSPLRYPGGKKKLAAFIAKICIDNNINGHYVEPYSGGASVALFLLMEGFVNRITINDKDKSIYAFWHSVLNNTEQLCELIKNAELTVSEWRKQRDIQSNKENAALLSLGFSTFYMNRTNRSGIITGGIIGGVQQKGDYPMDCRFNKDDLIKRIKKIASKKNQINLHDDEAIDLVNKIQAEASNNNVIFYFDPPYYLKASSLYMNHYDKDDHKTVSEKIQAIKNVKWIVSYDNVPEINKLYASCQKKEFSFKHTAYEAREGKEVLFFNDNVITPKIEDWDPLNFKLKRKTNPPQIIYKQKTIKIQ